MNLTLAIDDTVLERARERAKRLGISVQDVVRRHLEEFGGVSSSSTAANELRRLMEEQPGDSRGQSISRRDAYDGRI
ncbi:MAG TPA: hypothetical protein VEQ58_23935 [Polyangiaceae bacterium]|nr:hypothetical protein [Polyangiaceae bacterium]